MKRVLVTGASGFVGAHTALWFARAGYDVTAVGGSRECCDAVRREVSKCCSCDLSSHTATEDLLQTERPDVIIHAAALATTISCDRDPEAARRANVFGAENIVTTCQEKLNSSPILIFISTDLAYDGGEAPAGGFLESTPPQPSTVYARTKVEGEEIVKSYRGASSVVRTSLVYGAPIGGKGAFVSWMTDGFLSGKEITLFEDEYRTPIHVDDVAKGIELILKKSESQKIELLYHLGGPERLSRVEFGELLAEALGTGYHLIARKKISEWEEKIRRPSDASLNIDKFVTLTGFRPRPPREGLEAYVSALRDM